MKYKRQSILEDSKLAEKFVIKKIENTPTTKDTYTTMTSLPISNKHLLSS